MEEKSMDVITDKISAALQSLIGSGWKLPFYTAVVGSNGTMHFFQFVLDGDGSLKPEVLAVHETDPGFALPINIMFVNQDGRAARLLIEKSGEWGMSVLAGNC